MKKFLYVILLLSMIILPSACKKDETDPDQLPDKKHVFL